MGGRIGKRIPCDGFFKVATEGDEISQGSWMKMVAELFVRNSMAQVSWLVTLTYRRSFSHLHCFSNCPSLFSVIVVAPLKIPPLSCAPLPLFPFRVHSKLRLRGRWDVERGEKRDRRERPRVVGVGSENGMESNQAPAVEGLDWLVGFPK